MGRNKQFELNQVLDCAMREFWRKGYSATSIPRLETEMGISRQSLYDTFKSKRDLFLSVLEHYHKNIIVKNFSLIENSSSPKDGICKYFHARAKDALKNSDIQGCLVTNSIAELAQHDNQVRTQVNITLQHMRSVFRNALARSQKINEISTQLDIDTTADFLLNNAQGLFIMSRMNVDKSSVNGIVLQIESLLKK
ncbi:MAG: TetR/AcrR family transcriptional regulator [Gammaproteobacteria bacterium]|nr:TetR/AcrR family transcriptional regulator [Gammaproteobacteria bacterium]